MLHIPGLYIAPSDHHGIGVFTSEDLQQDDVIEVAPVVIIPKHDVAKIHSTILHDYYFSWGEKMDQAAIAMGYGGIYNHSEQPNCTFILDYDHAQIVFKSITKIKAGSELLINYKEGVKGVIDVWFDVK